MLEGMETGKKSRSIPVGGTSQKTQTVHMIGIGGSGMRALAQILIECGQNVSGSEAAHSSAVDRLTRAGARIAIGQRAENIPDPCDVVVYSAAIHEQNPELVAARQRGVEVLKYSQMLGRLMAERTGIAVSGTHGKSTTTAMVAYVLSQAGLEPTFVVGATVEQLGGPRGVGAGRHFVAEACEFDRSFLNLCPHYAAILNVEEDHLDCYRDIQDIIQAFRAFAARIPPEGVLVINGEDRNAQAAADQAACEVESFGLTDACTWQGRHLTVCGGKYAMDILYKGSLFAHLDVPLPGLHNAYNCLAATALLHHAGVSAEQIAGCLATFTGTRRRMTLKARLRGITVLDDYAHHPTEIQATLRAIQDYYQPGRLWCVFQPHQHSRTRFLLKDFARSFARATEVIVPDIYFVRDSEREKDCVSAEDLVAQIRFNGGTALYLKTFGQIVEHLQNRLQEGDLVVTMGAGSIWEVADDIVRWLGRDR